MNTPQVKRTSWTEYLKESSNWGKKIDFKTRYEMYATLVERLKREYNYNEVAFCKETMAMWGGWEWITVRYNAIVFGEGEGGQLV